MSAAENSRYQTARALAELPHTEAPARAAVCFAAGGYRIGRLNQPRRRSQCLIRLTLHEGQAIEIALSDELADRLGGDLLGRARPRHETFVVDGPEATRTR